MDGRFNTYTTELANRTTTQIISLKATSDMMNHQGVLDSSHLAIVSIKFFDDDENIIVEEDDERDGTNIFSAFQSIGWSFIFASLSGFFVMVLLTRYCFYSTTNLMSDITAHDD